MKLIILSFILFMLSINHISGQEFSIAFYNVENLFDTTKSKNKNDNEFLPNSYKKWNKKKYEEKIKKINTVIRSIKNPIIIGLCEIENKSVVEDIVNKGILKETHEVIHYESSDNRGIDNAIIYDKTKFKLIKSGIIRIELPRKHPPTRDIIWAKLNHLEDTIIIMVNHWPSRYGGIKESEPKRLAAAYSAKTFIDSIMKLNPKSKILFMGDLNDYPKNISTKIISRSLKTMIKKSSGKYKGTHNYKGKWNILDHIFVSKSLLKRKGIHAKKGSGIIHSNKFLLSTYKGQVVPFRTYGGKKYLNGYSDHLPVSVKIVLE